MEQRFICVCPSLDVPTVKRKGGGKIFLCCAQVFDHNVRGKSLGLFFFPLLTRNFLEGEMPYDQNSYTFLLADTAGDLGKSGFE